ncbi:MAG: hypothetical protein RR347_08695, partial [Anaerovoracaceae bacterium]
LSVSEKKAIVFLFIRLFFCASKVNYSMRAKYVETAKRLQIPESTADKQIARFLTSGLITCQAHGSNIKTST